MENRKLMLAMFMKILNDNKSNPDDVAANAELGLPAPAGSAGGGL